MGRVTLDPHQFFRRLPLAPHQMLDRLTRREDAIVLCHLGVPRIAREDWSLIIDGLVSSPRTLTFAELQRYPKIEVTSVHQCAGSPLAPSAPSQRVCNVTWGGARLLDMLADCGPDATATYVWSTGADFGEFDGVPMEAYFKDLPMARVAADVMIAYEMNGESLAPEHGFPARLVVPGFYGTNSVKWITRMTLARTRAQGPFTTRWYNDPAPADALAPNGLTVPVWSIAPQSIIVSPAPDATISVAKEIEIWGWAWADSGVRAVEVSVDGSTWMPAQLETPSGRAWQRFALQWRPRQPGAATLASRAISLSGAVQPEAGGRNAIYRVPATVL
jgi:DMSO/TMAO reductase YedYZ molybdopterin-dependent catalytic subunit